MATSTPFRNWAGNQTCLPTAQHRPASVTTVSSLVTRAAEEGTTVKAVGAGHSFTAAACTTGHLLSLDRLCRVESVERERGRVVVEAGITLADLNEELAGVGLGMPNLGDIAYQSVAGAIATATHGTGRSLGNLATTVVGLELVTADGEVVWCDAEHDPELFSCARVGIGALGIVTRVELQCVPAFDLHVRESAERLDEVLDRFDEESKANDHLEFFWIPGARRAQVKRNNRTDLPRDPPSRFEWFRDKIVAENLAFGTVCRVGRRFPAAVPAVAKLVSSGGVEREFVDRSDRVFASPRHVRFCEMEYSVPLPDLPEVFRELRAFCARLGEPIMFPVECRVSAADDIPLSTGHGRENAWIAVHRYRGVDYTDYFRGVEAIMREHEGRPHWGKIHFQDAESLAPRYPEWDRFQAVRRRVDPDGVFANAYTDRVLGPV